MIASNFTKIQTGLLLKTSVQRSLILIFFTQRCFNAQFRSITVKTYFLEKPGNFANKTAARFILKLTKVAVS